MRSLVAVMVLGVVMLGIASPTLAQDATPTPVPIGVTDQAEVTYQRLTLVGLIAFRATVGTIDGSVPDPVNVYMDAIAPTLPGLTEASPPKYGDAARMIYGTTDADGQAVEIAIVVIQDGNHVFLFMGSGLAMVLDEFLPLVDTLMQRPVTTLDAWLPTLADMPAGFTVST